MFRELANSIVTMKLHDPFAVKHFLHLKGQEHITFHFDLTREEKSHWVNFAQGQLHVITSGHIKP